MTISHREYFNISIFFDAPNHSILSIKWCFILICVIVILICNFFVSFVFQWQFIVISTTNILLNYWILNNWTLVISTKTVTPIVFYIRIYGKEFIWRNIYKVFKINSRLKCIFQFQKLFSLYKLSFCISSEVLCDFFLRKFKASCVINLSFLSF